MDPGYVAKLLRAYHDPVYWAQEVLGLTLYPKQAEILRRFYTEPLPREMVVVAGMRSGKSFLASLIALYEAFRLLMLPSPQLHYGLDPSSLIHIILVAASEEQARDALFRHITSWVKRDPFLSRGARVLKDRVEWTRKGVVIYAGSSSSSTMVGRTAKLVVFDELARFEQTEGKRGAWMVYTSLRASTATFGREGRRVIISSPIRSDDLLMQLYERDKEMSDAVVYKLPTWEMNPHIRFEDLREEMERDPIAFWRDFGCEPSETLHPYITRWDLVRWSEENVLPLLYEGLPWTPPTSDLVLGLDPAVKWDGFGIALAGREGDKYIVYGVDVVKPRQGEIDPREVRRRIKVILDHVEPRTVVVDTHMYPELHRWIMEHGVPVRVHRMTKRDFDRFKELLYAGRLVLPRHPVLERELKSLQVVNEKRVDHPRGGSKDTVDAVVLALTGLLETPPRYVPPDLIEAF